jgi:hypothetical protein
MLALFNVDIWHKHMKENIAPNVVGQKHQLRLVYIGDFKIDFFFLNCSLLQWFGQASDVRLKEGNQITFFLAKKFIYYKKNWLYVPKGGLRDKF